MPPYFTVSELARREGVRPRDISDLFYRRLLSDAVCPVVGGRRLIPSHYVPVVVEALRELRQKGGGSCPSTPQS